MTTHPTPRRTLFTVALCCLLPQSTIAQGLPRARPEDVGLSATAVIKLYERGTLRLDDPVSKYIPAFAAVKVYASGGAATPVLRDAERPMTLADLRTHTSGLTYGFIGNTPADSIYRRAGLN